MKNLFVPYQLALLAKQKSFDEECIYYYDANGKLCNLVHYKKGLFVSLNNSDNKFTMAPMHQQMVDWLRDQKRIIVCVELDQTSDMKFVIELYRYLTIEEMNSPKYAKQETRFERLDVPLEKWGYYRDYYKALNTAIEEAFKFI